LYNTTIKPFIGRERELELLDTLWDSPDASLLIVYGRRRVGKTRLLTHWINQKPRRALYWVAQPSSPQDQLRSFSQALYQFANPGLETPASFSYASWEQAIEQIAALGREGRTAVFIDEFTYLLANTPSIAGVFQNAWDHHLKNSAVFVALCGSHLGMMERYTLAYQAPLYGRATAQLRLAPLPYGATPHFFPNYDPASRVAVYALFGGIPAYWERFDPALSVSDNIRDQLLSPNNLMFAEPRLLLSDFIREPDNYISILRAIANNYRTQKEIAARSGLQQGHVSKYVSALTEAGFVERRTSVTASDQSRAGRYHIVDPYLRFYYRFLADRVSQFSMGITEPGLEEIKRHLLDYIGTNTWEELCREWALRAGANGTLPFMADQVGSAWVKEAQMDVAGVNFMRKTLIAGECKWSPKEVEAETLRKLARTTAATVPGNGQWQVYWVVFARGGWDTGARKLAGDPSFNQSVGRNWQSQGIRLVDLAQLDKDLREWS